MALAPEPFTHADACKPEPKQFLSKYQYLSEALTAKIVDGQTGNPVEGVVVMAVWGTLDTRGDDFKFPRNVFVHSVEVITDSQGVFTIPAWGPKTALRFQDSGPKRGIFIPTDPERKKVRADPFLVLHKRGYGTRVGILDFKDVGWKYLSPNKRGKSAYSGKSIKIWQGYTGRPEDEWDSANIGQSLSKFIGYGDEVDACYWTRFRLSIRESLRWVGKQYLSHEPEWRTQVLSGLFSCDAVRKRAGCPSFLDFVGAQ
jgi:hypothetical protein